MWNDEPASPTIGNVYSLLEPFTVKNGLFHTRSHHHVRKDSEAAEDIFHARNLSAENLQRRCNGKSSNPIRPHKSKTATHEKREK